MLHRHQIVFVAKCVAIRQLKAVVLQLFHECLLHITQMPRRVPVATNVVTWKTNGKVQTPKNTSCTDEVRSFNCKCWPTSLFTCSAHVSGEIVMTPKCDWSKPPEFLIFQFASFSATFVNASWSAWNIGLQVVDDDRLVDISTARFA
jgi:hypothetical protein